MSEVTDRHIDHWAAEPKHPPLGLVSFGQAGDDTRKVGMGGQGNREGLGGDGEWRKGKRFLVKDPVLALCIGILASLPNQNRITGCHC